LLLGDVRRIPLFDLWSRCGMPIEYVIDEERRLLEIVFLGAVTRD